MKDDGVFITLEKVKSDFYLFPFLGKYALDGQR